jgi:signal transduction histidine kinase
MRYVKYIDQVEKLKLNIEKEPLFLSLFNDAPDAIFILNAKDYSILDCNIKALDVFEAGSKSSLIDLSSYRLYESEPVEFSRDTLETSLRNGGEYTQELAFRTLKQNIFWGRLKKRSIRIEADEYVILRISKVIDYLRAEETLSSLLRGTAKFTGKKYFKELTKLLCRSFDVKYSFIAKLSVDKKSLKILEYAGPIHEKDLNKYPVMGSMTENVVKGYTTFYPKGANELFPEDIMASNYKIEGFMGTPLYGTSGEVVGVLAFMHDKTFQEIPNSRYILSIFASRSAAEIQRMRSKEILKEQTQSLANANTLKDKLLSVISHNLINPLQSALGFSELLRSKIDHLERSKIIENVEIIDNSIRNIYFLIENLSDWSRIYRDKIHMHPEDISIPELIEDNLLFLKYIIDFKEIVMDVKLQDIPKIHTDRHMLDTIIRNILSNAVKYSSKWSEISIYYKESEHELTLFIKDSGIGMSEDDINTIYGAGDNIPELNMVNKNVNGFGLLLTRNFIKRLGGNLIIRSQQNKGTEVEFSIPRK